jgi:hypothetical protein
MLENPENVPFIPSFSHAQEPSAAGGPAPHIGSPSRYPIWTAHFQRVKIAVGRLVENDQPISADVHYLSLQDRRTTAEILVAAGAREYGVPTRRPDLPVAKFFATPSSKP